MKITSAEFVKSVYDTTQCPVGDVPEISFLGAFKCRKIVAFEFFAAKKGARRVHLTLRGVLSASIFSCQRIDPFR